MRARDQVDGVRPVGGKGEGGVGFVRHGLAQALAGGAALVPGLAAGPQIDVRIVGQRLQHDLFGGLVRVASVLFPPLILPRAGHGLGRAEGVVAAHLIRSFHARSSQGCRRFPVALNNLSRINLLRAWGLCRRERRGRRRRAYAASSTVTGTWSDGFSRPRRCFCTEAETSRSAACGESRRWSMRMPKFRDQAAAW